MNSAAVWKRFSRSRDSARSTTASSAGGTAGAMVDGAGMGASAMRRRVSNSVSPRKSRRARERLPQHDAGAEDVGAPVDGLRLRLLGGHVAELALEAPAAWSR